MTLSGVGTLATIGMTGVSNVCALFAPKLTGDCDLGYTQFVGLYRFPITRPRMTAPRVPERLRQCDKFFNADFFRS
jgi:hypothetical protein